MDESDTIVLARIEELANRAGIRGRIDREAGCFEARFSLPQNRSQVVYCHSVGRAMDGSILITVFSPCLTVEAGFLKGMSKRQVMDLLRRNSETKVARYGIRTSNGEERVEASADRSIESLGHQDLESLFWAVAVAADEFEKELGNDEF